MQISMTHTMKHILAKCCYECIQFDLNQLNFCATTIILSGYEVIVVTNQLQ